MACLKEILNLYLTLGANVAITLPQAVQIDDQDSADWLLLTLGIANNAGVPSNSGLWVRVYSGNFISPVNAFQSVYNINSNPVFTGSGQNQNLIPWAKRLQLAIEVLSNGSWAAGSTIDLCLQAFNNGD